MTYKWKISGNSPTYKPVIKNASIKCYFYLCKWLRNHLLDNISLYHCNRSNLNELYLQFLFETVLQESTKFDILTSVYHFEKHIPISVAQREQFDAYIHNQVFQIFVQYKKILPLVTRNKTFKDRQHTRPISSKSKYWPGTLMCGGLMFCIMPSASMSIFDFLCRHYGIVWSHIANAFECDVLCTYIINYYILCSEFIFCPSSQTGNYFNRDDCGQWDLCDGNKATLIPY